MEAHFLIHRPELESQVDRLSQQTWPTFLLHGNADHWSLLFQEFAALQILLCEPADAVVAVGHTVPLVWNGTNMDLPPGIEAVLVRALEGLQRGLRPTALCALAAMVAPEHQARGLGLALLRSMQALAAKQDLTDLIAPVRPTAKSLYPLTSFERYVQWQRKDGLPFDPWLRVHWRLGAKPLGTIPQALEVRGTVAEWEEWTGLRFPESGQYVVSGALQPVWIDCERDEGRYEDPNLWMRHRVPLDNRGSP